MMNNFTISMKRVIQLCIVLSLLTIIAFPMIAAAGNNTGNNSFPDPSASRGSAAAPEGVKMWLNSVVDLVYWIILIAAIIALCYHVAAGWYAQKAGEHQQSNTSMKSAIGVVLGLIMLKIGFAFIGSFWN